MKNSNVYGMAILAASLLGTVPLQAEDVVARVFFNGSVLNNPTRQTVQGSFAGNGEFGPFDSDARINGTIRTQPLQRPARSTVYGNYPVQIYARARKGELTVSDTFSATADLRRRYLLLRGYGRIDLNRPVSPNRPGRQILRGYGTFRYDF